MRSVYKTTYFILTANDAFDNRNKLKQPNPGKPEPKILKKGYIRPDLQDGQDGLMTQNRQASRKSC